MKKWLQKIGVRYEHGNWYAVRLVLWFEVERSPWAFPNAYAAYVYATNWSNDSGVPLAPVEKNYGYFPYCEKHDFYVGKECPGCKEERL